MALDVCLIVEATRPKQPRKPTTDVGFERCRTLTEDPGRVRAGLYLARLDSTDSIPQVCLVRHPLHVVS